MRQASGTGVGIAPGHLPGRRRSRGVRVRRRCGEAAQCGPAQRATTCWPPSMSYVAPVSAVLAIRCTASAATSSGPMTRPIGRVARSSLAALLELVAEQRRRQRRVDEAGGDQVDAHRRELEREVGDERRAAPRSAPRSAPSPTPGRRPPVPPMNSSVPPGRTLPAASRATCTDSQQVLVDVAAGLGEVEVPPGARSTGRPAGDQDVVDRRRQAREEPCEARPESVASNAAVLPRAHLARGALQPLRVAAGQDHLGALGVRRRAVSSPMPGASADHDDGLPAQLRLVGGGRSVVMVVLDQAGPAPAACAPRSPRGAP